MREVKNKIKKLKEGKKYKAKCDDYLIQEKHTIADIVRFAIKCSGISDVQYCLNEERKRKGN